ncbi:MAG: hypothetical protein PHI12_07555 [Dehalococcoidales bacterium]|nr:hypothetical protein [Dehalococcoidales bacterium]
MENNFEKLVCYGTPTDELGNDNWFRWIRFVDILVWGDSHTGKPKFTNWYADSLYGYTHKNLERPGLFVEGIKQHSKEAIDYRIETHKDLFEISQKIMRWIVEQEQIRAEKLVQIKSLIEGF